VKEFERCNVIGNDDDWEILSRSFPDNYGLGISVVVVGKRYIFGFGGATDNNLCAKYPRILSYDTLKDEMDSLVLEES
jgi:hypothetical protein